MLGSTLILIASLIAQAPATPPSRPVAAAAPAGVQKQWLVVASPVDGKPTQILGWLDGGIVRFDPAEYPTFAAALAKAAPSQAQPTGVVFSKFPVVTGASWTGGNAAPIAGDAAHPGKIEAPDVFVTIIGPKRERDRVKLELSRDPAFASVAREMGGRLAVEAYDPKNPLVADVGLVAGGKPDVVVLDAGGKEIARFPDDPGPGPILEAVRKADPNYTPGGKSPAKSESLGPGWIVAGLVALYFLLKPRKASS